MVGNEWKNAFHYDLIVFSNFLTSDEQVTRLSKELRSAGRALRNKRVILVVGGRERQYPSIYASVKSLLCKSSYVKKKSVSRISEVTLDSNEMEYAVEGQHGDVIKRVIRNVLEAIRNHKEESRIETCTLAKMRRFINNASDIRKWAVHVYQKRAVFPKP
jgi:hypothetical protein